MDKEAKRKLKSGCNPLSFEQVYTIDGHQPHQQVVAYLQKTSRPCIVIVASGMCSGVRIMAYLKALIEDERTDSSLPVIKEQALMAALSKNTVKKAAIRIGMSNSITNATT